MRTVNLIVSILILSLLMTVTFAQSNIFTTPGAPAGGFGQLDFPGDGSTGEISGMSCYPFSTGWGNYPPGYPEGCYGSQSVSIGFPGFADLKGGAAFYIVGSVPVYRGIGTFEAAIYAPYGCSVIFGYDTLNAQVNFMTEVGPYAPDNHWDAGMDAQASCEGPSCETGEDWGMYVIGGYSPTFPETWGDGEC